MEIPNDNSPFAEINDYIFQLFYSRDEDLLETFSNPIEWSSIGHLKKNDWEILIENLLNLEGTNFENLSNLEGTVDFENKIMRISELLCPYKRDKAICHEIVHAVYGKRFNDTLGLRGLKDNVIVEWTGRRIRASPTLLAYIWDLFSIPPRIYDRASFLATQKAEKRCCFADNQLLFPSFDQDYNFTLID